MTLEQIAKICHQANKALCESIGDVTQVNWENAPMWQQESAVNGVKFALENPDATPADQHESWSAQKLADGWVYGETKDAEAKTHPCLVPYSELPKEQQAKDALFIAIVNSLAPYTAIPTDSNSF